MKQSEAIAILEALADGCSPFSGEVLPPDHLLMEEPVIEAILIALEALQGKASDAEVELPSEEIGMVVTLFHSVEKKPTAAALTHFFGGTRAFKIPELLRHPLYGKYGGRYAKEALSGYIAAWVDENLAPQGGQRDNEPHPYFNEPHFNRLSEKAILQLREKVAAIPLVRTEGLGEALIERRKTIPRSHEPWPDEEVRLLTIALDFTNDADFLASCFGRSTTAIFAQANKLLRAKFGEDNEGG